MLTRATDELGQALQAGEADRRLHVREAAFVLLGQRIERPDGLPQALFRLAADERCDVPHREERKGEHFRADEGVLPLARLQDLFDALLARPRLGIGRLPDAPRDLGVAHPRQPAAIGVEWLERLEAEKARVPHRADHLPLVFRAERMGTVLDDLEIVAARDIEDRIHVARHAVEVRRQDRPGVGRDCGLDRRRIERERAGKDVDEHRREAGDARDFRHDPEGERRHDDLAARRKVHGLEDEVERRPSVIRRAGLDVPGAAEEAGELLFERFDLRTADELLPLATVTDDLRHFRDDAAPESSDSVHESFRWPKTLSYRKPPGYSRNSSRGAHAHAAARTRTLATMTG